MRYFYLAYFLSHLFVFHWIQTSSQREPASLYPHFLETSNLNTPSIQPPEPRKLGPPLNPNSITSMKDIEDSYREGFLPQEIALRKELTASRFRLDQLMSLRRSAGVSYNSADVASSLRQAIRFEQNRFADLQARRAANSQFAYFDIQSKYMATQIGLKPESHQRVAELMNYLLHVYFEASSAQWDTTFQGSAENWARTDLFRINPEQPLVPGTVDREAVRNDSVDENFIGPMPAESDVTVEI